MARRQPDHKAGASNGRLAVGVGGPGAIFRPDAAAMGFDDLFRDRQPQPGILSETLVRPVGVKALEDSLQRILANSRPIVIDDDVDLRSQAPADDRTLPPAVENDWALTSRLEITWPSREL